MSSISNVLVQQSHLDIFNCSRLTGIDIKGWIANQKYYVDHDLESNKFSVRSSDKEYLMAALANDCNRMAMAAIESISGIQVDNKLNKSGAWGIIRTYYSSFFAVHSIMRMFGISCSHLDQIHADKIFELANAMEKTGNLKRLDKGLYSVEIDKNFSNVVFCKYKDSHKDTWGIFLKLIENLISNTASVSALSVHKNEVIDILLNVKKGITRSRCGDKGNWLSVVRNSVNYQHSYGVWYPYERKQVAHTYIQKLSQEWMKKPYHLSVNLDKNDIEVFFEVSLIIDSLFKELLVSCFNKAGNASKIFSNGSIKLLKLLYPT